MLDQNDRENYRFTVAEGHDTIQDEMESKRTHVILKKGKAIGKWKRISEKDLRRSLVHERCRTVSHLELVITDDKTRTSLEQNMVLPSSVGKVFCLDSRKHSQIEFY